MPTFNILLAHDVSYYGNVSVEADTWQEAVASLTAADWGDNCTDSGDAWEQRVCDVEDEAGNMLAMDLAFDCHTVGIPGVIQRLREIQIAADLDAALALFIDELRTMGQDPIFKKESV